MDYKDEIFLTMCVACRFIAGKNSGDYVEEKLKTGSGVVIFHFHENMKLIYTTFRLHYNKHILTIVDAYFIF